MINAFFMDHHLAAPPTLTTPAHHLAKNTLAQGALELFIKIKPRIMRPMMNCAHITGHAPKGLLLRDILLLSRL